MKKDTPALVIRGNMCKYYKIKPDSTPNFISYIDCEGKFISISIEKEMIISAREILSVSQEITVDFLC